VWILTLVIHHEAAKRRISLVRHARNERRRAARRLQREPRISKCVVCGASFKHQRKTRRYCSARCRIAAYREKAIKSNRV
jgi:predicted nucleic acid-binding Zn ribbon protein